MMTQRVPQHHAYSWGRNSNGRLGLGDAVEDGKVVNIPTKINVGDITWTQLACGECHMVALSSTGEVFTWGDGYNGKLGHGDEEDKNVPTKVQCLAEERIVKVACGDFHSAALTSTGKLFTWGVGLDGQLGHGGYQNLYYPRIVEALDNEIIVDIKCGPYSTFAFTSSGLVYYFGYSLPFDDEVTKPTIHHHFNGKKVNSFQLGHAHGAFVTEVGELFTWGSGEYGKLGHGDTLDQTLPKLVEGLSGIVCKQVSCDVYHTVVVTTCGKVYTFGCGGFGQLGHGDTEDTYLPTLVQTLETTDIVQVYTTKDCTTMALSTSGFLYAWGSLDFLFRNRQSYQNIPCIVDKLRQHNVVQLSDCIRGEHCAVLVDPSPSPIREAQHFQFNNKDKSDVTFMVEDQPLYGIIEVLSRKSQYFKAMFRSNMRECIDGVVVVPDVSAAVFLKMLEYLCLDDFLLDDMDDASRKELSILADMYLLDGLRLLCYDEIDKEDI